MIDQVNIKKMHHRAAGDTEVAAAHQVAKRVAGKRLHTLQTLWTLGGGSGEQVALAASLPITSIRPRLTELLQMELILDTGARQKNEYLNFEIVWAITEKGKQYVY
tara:strand:+ start:1609 stop:1926 length:318 start_codon:yes stop_codon:yes gene_type:complete